jgi:hypothetical protein
VAGLGKHNYRILSASDVAKLGPGDLLVTWNRNGGHDAIAAGCERRGAKVMVVENGYIGTDAHSNKLYAMALGQHNGAGKWTVGKEDRWSNLGIALQPWRSKGAFILLVPQRGIGSPSVRMQPSWLTQTTAKLERMTERPVVLRRHPGVLRHHKPIEPEFQNCWAVVTWASGGGIKAIVCGIPVFYGLENWIGAPAGLPFEGADLETPFLGDRLPMLQRMAWAQWKVDEIASGAAFACLMS